MCGTLGALDFVGGFLGAPELLGARGEQIAVGLFFTALALRSRIFARLPAPRPRKGSYGTIEEVVDLNKLSTEDLDEEKARMEVLFQANRVERGDAGYEYDIQRDFGPATVDNDWDSSSAESA